MYYGKICCVKSKSIIFILKYGLLSNQVMGEDFLCTSQIICIENFVTIIFTQK